MIRVVQNTSQQIRRTLLDAEGNAAVVADATIRIVSDDGTELVPTSALTQITSTTYGYTLTATHTALLDRLAVYWTATLGGQTQTFTDIVEVVGGRYFSMADFKAISLGGAKTIGSTYDTDALLDMRTTVEDAIEHATGMAFVPRYSRARLSGYGTQLLRVGQPYLRAIRWATVDSTALTVDELAGVSIDLAGYAYGLNNWTLGHGNVIVGFEHGMDEPPPRVRKAALLLAKTWIVSGPVDDRVTTMSSPDTGITAALAVPGRGGSIVGVPEVDAVINEYRLLAVA